MELTAEQNRQRIDLLRNRQAEAKLQAMGLAQAIRDNLADVLQEPATGKTVGGLAAQYDEAITKFKVYTVELYECGS